MAKAGFLSAIVVVGFTLSLAGADRVQGLSLNVLNPDVLVNYTPGVSDPNLGGALEIRLTHTESSMNT